MVPDLVQGSRLAAKGDLDARSVSGNSSLDLRKSVRLACARHNTRSFEPLVAGKYLEEIYRFLEVLHNLFGSLVVSVAIWYHGGNASSMLGPLVFPESLIIALIVLPVGIHVVEEVRGTKGSDYVGDVGVCTRWITVSLVGAIALVGPLRVVISCPFTIRSCSTGEHTIGHELSSYQMGL